MKRLFVLAAALLMLSSAVALKAMRVVSVVFWRQVMIPITTAVASA